jgi:peroxiredoxin
MKRLPIFLFILSMTPLVLSGKFCLHLLQAQEAKVAPDFELSDLEDKKYRLSAHRGKIIVINFWETWCPACIKEMPSLNRLVDNYKNQEKVLFWAISHEDKLTLQEYLSKNKFNYHQFYNGLKVRKAYNVQFVPVHMLIDPKGKIRYSFPADDQVYSKLNKGIKNLLKEFKED